FILGLSNLRKKQYSVSREHFEQAIKLSGQSSPGSELFDLFIGSTHKLENRNLELAESAYRSSREIGGPNYARANLGLGMIAYERYFRSRGSNVSQLMTASAEFDSAKSIAGRELTRLEKSTLYDRETLRFVNQI